MIYQISIEQSDINGQKFFQYKKAMLKDSKTPLKFKLLVKNYRTYLKKGSVIN